jgi:predicted nucleic acid-binding protein
LRSRRRAVAPAPPIATRSLRDLATLGVAVDPDTVIHAWSSTLALAEAHGLTIYAAVYLELALRRKARLASLDRKLRAAGLALRLTLLGV